MISFPVALIGVFAFLLTLGGVVVGVAVAWGRLHSRIETLEKLREEDREAIRANAQKGHELELRLAAGAGEPRANQTGTHRAPVIARSDPPSGVTVTGSGSLKVVDAPRVFALEAGAQVDEIVREVIAEARAKGEAISDHAAGFLPRVVGQRASTKLRPTLEKCFREGFRCGREDR